MMTMSTQIMDISEDFMKRVSERFKMLSHPARLRILALLEGNELTVSELQGLLGMSQAKVSQHLSAMRNHDAIGYRQDGSLHYYFIEDQNICGILRCIEKAHATRGGK